MSWLTRGGTLALIAVAVAVLLAARRRGEVWHSLAGQGSDTGP